ncbi:MAG: RagB/SusD family nutrient uptake outer membrane protein, partial [Bacteroidales bacterium]|nr:RagB/SusD family nutrient uptake outer membrane protein [Bacteroidales bacterium]
MKNMITRNKIWILLVPVLALLFSCSEKLDIRPKQSIDAEAALTTPDNIQATLIGAYLTARSANIFGSQFNEYSELYATTGDMIFIGTYQQPREFEDKEATVTNSYVSGTWIDGYQLINICNTLLDEETLAILDDEDKSRIEGEARFLRGWVMFEMIRYFGLPYEPGQANSQP